MARLMNSKALERDLADLPWTSWSPTITAAAGTFTSTTVNYARYLKIGKIVFYQISVTSNDAGTAAFDVRISTPSGVNPASNACGCGRETAATGNMIETLTSGNLIVAWFFNNTFPLATGRTIIVGGFYRTS